MPPTPAYRERRPFGALPAPDGLPGGWWTVDDDGILTVGGRVPRGVDPAALAADMWRCVQRSMRPAPADTSEE